MSYPIATSELTLTDIKTFKNAAIQAGIKRAMDLRIAQSDRELVVREALPFTDFGNNALGWTTEWYRGPVIAAIGWGSVFNAGAVPAFVPQLARTKVAVFYKFSDYTAAPMISAIRFRQGANAASTLGTFDVQLPTNSKLEPDLYFSEPIDYDPEDWVYIEAYYMGAVPAGIVGAGENFAFGCFIIERVGGNVS